MSWFKSKTKEEKIQELQKKVNELNEKWKNEINSYCKINNYIFILKGFKHDGKYVCIQFVDKDTPEEFISYNRYSWWELKYEQTDFNICRYQFIKFKDELKKIGLKLEKEKEL
jgi:hypothetical protein